MRGHDDVEQRRRLGRPTGWCGGARLPLVLTFINLEFVSQHSEQPRAPQPAIAEVSPETHSLRKDSRDPSARQHPFPPCILPFPWCWSSEFWSCLLKLLLAALRSRHRLHPPDKEAEAQGGEGSIRAQTLVCLPPKLVFSLPCHVSVPPLWFVLQLLVAPPASPVLFWEEFGCHFCVCLRACEPWGRTGSVLLTTASPSLRTVPGIE